MSAKDFTGTACAVLVALHLAAVPTLQAQADRTRLTVVVVDQSGAAIPEARAELIGEDAADVSPLSQAVSRPGEIVFRVTPGTYSLRVSAPGFRSATVERLRVRGREVSHRLRLTIDVFSETVLVERDRQSASLEARGFSTVLTREQIDALPDDPESFAQALRDLAPPGAVIRIDGFSGGNMPPKSQILAIRIPRIDTFAAQDHGGLSALSYIEIITSPGGGSLRGSVEGAFRIDSLNARNPLSPDRAPASWRVGTFSADGPILRDRLSFALSVRAGRQEETSTVRAAMPDGAVLYQSVPKPMDLLSASARVSLRVGDGHTLRAGATHDRQRQGNVGVGDFNLVERAAVTSSSDTTVRLAFSGPAGRRGVVEWRAQLRTAGSRSASSVEAPTIRVLDAFTSGGAQVAGGTRLVELGGAVDIDYVSGRHAFKVGMLLDAAWHRSSRRSNYLGTFTFANLQDFNAGRPAAYSRRFGTPVVAFREAQVATYAQDDFRVARSLLFNYGVRVEQQTLGSGRPAVLPRGGVTWSPRRDGRTVVRTGAGVFSDWLPAPVYEQSLILDGRQRDVLILSPGNDVHESEWSTVPRERYLLAPDLQMPRNAGVSLGVEHQLTTALRLVATYGYRSGWRLLHARNINPLEAGRRPAPEFGNVIETRNGAASRTRTMTLQAVRIVPGGRFDLALAYAMNHSRSNAAGPFSLSPGGLDAEWGSVSPAHVVNANVVSRISRRIQVTLTPTWRSGTPYSITTGRDDNGDGAFTERPAGTPRNSARTAAVWLVSARAAYALAFGESPNAGSSPSPRFRAEGFVSAQNVLNRATYATYGGVIDSPFFGRPTSAVNPRRLDFGVRVSF